MSIIDTQFRLMFSTLNKNFDRIIRLRCRIVRRIPELEAGVRGDPTADELFRISSWSWSFAEDALVFFFQKFLNF